RATRSPSSTPCSPSTARPRTRARASLRSSRSANRSGRASDQWLRCMADEPELHDWKPFLEDLAVRRERAYGMGGPDRVERQRSLGKLPVRQRLDLLLDPGTFVEYSLLADHMDPALTEAGRDHLAADGMVAGIGEIEGRPVAVMAYDFTVMGGSM